MAKYDMSQPKEDIGETGKIAIFFAPKTRQNKFLVLAEESQDGSEEPELEPLRSMQALDHPVTDGVLKTMLDAMSEQRRQTLQSSLGDLRKYLQELGARTATVENTMAEYTEARADMAIKMDVV
ncbi:Hypothetical predicted protein [Pelobates cultripes]|uniref:Uncharacterized protein n=1 Tax=Pelobates cultripes TaxID=61616 RepID=A0AAD1TM31_PELCU|nr:Hypothetical predicted protein [Pelobates cultripes]